MESPQWQLPSEDEVRTKLDLRDCPCICNHYNFFEAMLRSNKRVVPNDFVDSSRVTEAPYVHIFTCDKHVKNLLQQARFVQAGGRPCSKPAEVLAALAALPAGP